LADITYLVSNSDLLFFHVAAIFSSFTLSLSAEKKHFPRLTLNFTEFTEFTDASMHPQTMLA